MAIDLDGIEKRVKPCLTMASGTMATKDTHDIIALIAEVRRLRETLEEIARGEGPFSIDPLEHCANCLEATQDIARQALQDKDHG